MVYMDYNIDDYTISELFTILELNEADEQQVIDKTNNYIDYYNQEKSYQLSNFFQEIQDTLITYIENLDDNTEDNTDNNTTDQTNNWITYNALPQDNSVQQDKNTDRIQKVDVYDNERVPMTRQQLGVTNTKNIPVSQDNLNPNLKNITTRLINLDSQFRQASGGLDTVSTDYTLDLSDPLTDVLSLRLYSFQIPFTWYVIDHQYGNTCFWVTNQGTTSTNTFKIYIEPGNYTTTTFCTAINYAFTNVSNFPTFAQGFNWSNSDPLIQQPDIATINPNNGKISINLSNDWSDPDGNPITGINDGDILDTNMNPFFTFFDITGNLRCISNGQGCSAQTMSFNGTLGWLMGYRAPILPIYIGGNNAPSVIDLYGPRNFILVIDDYNQNHINNGLINITELSTKLAMPNYYVPTMPYTCVSNTGSSILSGFPNDITNLGDKLALGQVNIPQVLPSAPRTLTQAQIYTINEITKNKSKNTSYRGKAPTASDTFALLPIKRGNLTTGGMYVEFSGALQDNKRIYFGPVDIDRMKIRLLDDRGYVVDLHGAEWCITLISENLYQY